MNHAPIILFLAVLSIPLAVLAIVFYVRLGAAKRRWETLRSGCVGAHESQGPADGRQTYSDLAFKIGMVIRSGQIALWDYDIPLDRFCYLNGESPVPDTFRWIDHLTLIHPDDRHVPKAAMQRLWEDKTSVEQFSFRSQILGGATYRWFDIVAVVYHRDANGKPDMISGLRRDMTESVREKQELADKKTMLELTFEAAGIVPWEFDLAGQELISDNDSSVLFGQDISVRQYIGTFIHPDHRPSFSAAVSRLLDGMDECFDQTVMTLCEDRYEWTHIVGRVVPDPRNGGRRVLGTRQFVTAEVEKQQELETLRRKAEESDRQKSAFLANMTHEIRTPLNTIVGFSNLIAETDDPVQAREFARLIESNNELLMRLVNDILDMSRIEAGQLEFSFGEVDLCSVFRDLRQTYYYRMPDGVELLCELPDDTCVIRTDRNRFVQVVTNFLNNAVKFTSCGSIAMGYERTKEGLRFFVRDTGRGISAENLPRVFERFSKFDPTVKGTGLGLSICDTIVQKFGGRIGADSEFGKGSEFWFVIPCAN